jgi:hypothetical protein
VSSSSVNWTWSGQKFFGFPMWIVLFSLGKFEDRYRGLRISGFLFRVDMPDNIIWQPVNAVASSFGHFGESFGLGLVLEGIARKVDA